MTVRLLTAWLAWSLFTVYVTAQTHSPTLECGTDQVTDAWLEANPDARRRTAADEEAYRAAVAKRPNEQKSLPPPYTLPIVFHVVHGGGNENISEQRILDGLAHANEAFANQGFYDRGTGVDTRMQFCLAERTPQNTPTNGITRRNDPLTNLEYRQEDRDLKALVQWDPTQYINVYVVREICQDPGAGCGVAGYAYYPGAHGGAVDGIVLEARFLGSSQANAGVLVHELGHYFGLRHTFDGGCENDDCLQDGDRVCDTPPDQSTAAVPCSGSANSCTTDTNSGFASDQDDMIQNYMDYGYWNCYSAFTAGQRDRMYFFLEGRRRSLLSSYGCQEPCPTPSVAAFDGGDVTVDVGATITFTNQSSNGGLYEWRLDGTTVSSAVDLTRNFPTEGTFRVQLLVRSLDGRCAPDSIIQTVRVVCPVVADFQSTTAPAGTPLTFVNTSTNATTATWRINGTSAPSPGPNLDFTFPTAGVYEVCLTAGNGNCEREKCRRVFIFPVGGGVTPDSCGSPLSVLYERARTQNGSGFLNTLALASNGGYYLGGEVDNQPFIMRVDGSGTPLWTTQLFPGGDGGRVTFLTEDADGFLAGLSITDNVDVIGGTNQAMSSAFRLNATTGAVVWCQRLVLSGATSPMLGSTSFKKLFQTAPGADYQIIGDLGTDHIRSYGCRLTVNPLSGLPSAPAIVHLLPLRAEFNDAYHVPATGELRLVGLANANATNGQMGSGIRFARLDAAGSMLSERLIHTLERTSSNRQLIAADGVGSVVAYDLLDDGPNNGSIWVQRLDGNHRPVWIREIRTDVSVRLRAMTVNTVGYLLLMHDTNRFDYLVQLDRAGEVVWARSYQSLIPTVDAFSSPLAMDGDRIVLATNRVISALEPMLLRLPPNGIPAGTCLPSLPIDVTSEPRRPPTANFISQQIQAQIEADAFGAEPLVYVARPESCVADCPPSEEVCDNGDDDDGDGAIDCDDDDLAGDCCCLVGPTIDLGPDRLFCGPTMIALDSLGAGWTVVWSTGAGGDSIPVDSAGSYAVTVTDTCGRVALDTIALHPRARLPLDLGPDTTVCENAVVTYRAPTGFARYAWSDGTTNTSFTTFAAGTFWLRATDSCGVTVSDTVRVSYRPTTTFDLGRDTTICRGDTLAFRVSGFRQYQWSKSSFLDCDDCPEVRFAPTVDTLLLLTATAGPGCFSFDSIRVRVRSEPGRRNAFQLCPGDSLRLGDTLVRGAGTYTFASPGVSCTRVDTAVVSLLPPQASLDTAFLCRGEELLIFGELVTAPGDYQTVLTAANGCDSVRTLRVLPLALDTTVFDTLRVCPGDSITIADTTVSEPGTYRFSYPWLGGCDSVQVTTVAWVEIPRLALPDVQRVILGDSVFLRAGGDFAPSTLLRWRRDGDTTGVVITNQLRLRPASSQRWTAEVPGAATTCPTTAAVRVEVVPGKVVYVPTAFSPNNDGVNDVFWPGFGPAVDEVTELAIYNRWGGQAFRVENVPANSGAAAGAVVGWDGRAEAVGLYVYHLRVRLFTGEEVSQVGEVMLLR